MIRKFKNTFVNKETFDKKLKELKGNVYLLDKPMHRQKRCSRLNVCWNTQVTSVLLTDFGKFVYETENDTLTAEELKLKNKWQADGAAAWKIGQLYWKCPKIAETEIANQLPTIQQADGQIKFACGESALLYGNPKFEGKWVKAYGYDRNSAFAAGMLKEMPDTSKQPRSGKIGKGEIGFDILDGKLTVLEKGQPARWIFPAMKSPFEKFVKVYYERKANAKSKWERAYYKGVLNFYVGYLQIYNPFLRSAIICYSNDFILNCMDADTIACNTDSIVSLKPRPDLTLGLGLGEFKEEHIGEFAFKGKSASISQWKNDEKGNNKSCTPGIAKLKKGEDFCIFTPKYVTHKRWMLAKTESQQIAFEFKEI